MADLAHANGPTLLGALIGWRRFPLPHGSLVRLQVARAAERARAGDFEEFEIGLSATQLRALAADMTRAADEADGVPTESERKRSWWLR